MMVKRDSPRCEGRPRVGYDCSWSRECDNKNICVEVYTEDFLHADGKCDFFKEPPEMTGDAPNNPRPIVKVI